MNNIMETLIYTALKSNMKHKHGCVILYKNKIISSGYNSYIITNKIYNNHNECYVHDKYSIHAEKDAIQKIKNKNILKKCIIYIIRLKNSNEINIKKLHMYYTNIEIGLPCTMCNNLINKYNIRCKNII